jgi:hypothetical protein
MTLQMMTGFRNVGATGGSAVCRHKAVCSRRGTGHEHASAGGVRNRGARGGGGLGLRGRGVGAAMCYST